MLLRLSQSGSRYIGFFPPTIALWLFFSLLHSFSVFFPVHISACALSTAVLLSSVLYFILLIPLTSHCFNYHKSLEAQNFPGSSHSLGVSYAFLKVSETALIFFPLRIYLLLKLLPRLPVCYSHKLIYHPSFYPLSLTTVIHRVLLSRLFKYLLTLYYLLRVLPLVQEFLSSCPDHSHGFLGCFSPSDLNPLWTTLHVVAKLLYENKINPDYATPRLVLCIVSPNLQDKCKLFRRASILGLFAKNVNWLPPKGVFIKSYSGISWHTEVGSHLKNLSPESHGVRSLLLSEPLFC